MTGYGLPVAKDGDVELYDVDPASKRRLRRWSLNSRDRADGDEHAHDDQSLHRSLASRRRPANSSSPVKHEL
jgi:hypothetical protein